MNGKEYKVGQDFIPDDCSGSCTCKGGGNMACNSLCPPSYVSCKPGEQIENYKEAVTGSNCYCKRQRCVKGNYILIKKYTFNPLDIGRKLNVHKCVRFFTYIDLRPASRGHCALKNSCSENIGIYPELVSLVVI